jgi:hypothetical protein
MKSDNNNKKSQVWMHKETGRQTFRKRGASGK